MTQEEYRGMPYIGITDFDMRVRVEVMRKLTEECFPLSDPNMRRRLHVGVMMSKESLQGETTEWSAVWPAKEDIPSILSMHGVMNCLHYADHGTDRDLSATLRSAICYGGPMLDALQLDMTWPDPEEVAVGIQFARKPLEVILLVGPKALKECEHDSDSVAERISQYRGIAHYALLDLSLGHGKKMDPDILIPLARAIKKQNPEMDLAVAGGLGPDTIGELRPFLEEFPDISFDAQSKLRKSGSAKEPINWDLAEGYVRNAAMLLHGKPW